MSRPSRGDGLCPAADEERELPPGQIVVPSDGLELHQVRAAAIRRASADYIVLAEDHCLPDTDFAEVILRRVALSDRAEQRRSERAERVGA